MLTILTTDEERLNARLELIVTLERLYGSFRWQEQYGGNEPPIGYLYASLLSEAFLSFTIVMRGPSSIVESDVSALQAANDCLIAVRILTYRIGGKQEVEEDRAEILPAFHGLTRALLQLL